MGPSCMQEQNIRGHIYIYIYIPYWPQKGLPTGRLTVRWPGIAAEAPSTGASAEQAANVEAVAEVRGCRQIDMCKISCMGVRTPSPLHARCFYFALDLSRPPSHPPRACKSKVAISKHLICLCFHPARRHFFLFSKKKCAFVEQDS